MYIDGVILDGYRSFGPEPQFIGPFGKVNIFVGRNNSGKSNILRYIYEEYNIILDITYNSKVYQPSGLKRNQSSPNPPILGFGISKQGITFKKVLGRHPKLLELESTNRKLWKQFLDLFFDSQVGIRWYQFASDPSSSKYVPLHEDIINFQNNWGILRGVSNAFGLSRQLDRDQLVNTVLARLHPGPTNQGQIYFIPPFRKIVNKDEEEFDLSGTNLITQLNRLQNPRHDEPDAPGDWLKINHFLEVVTGDSGSRLHIPHDLSTVELENARGRFPLEAIGTGIHEVIMIAAAATLKKKSVICIEEPEIHLHPLLQRQLIKYLCDETDNQYFLATHSAHLLDSELVHAFHVELVGEGTVVRRVLTPGDRSRLCRDLGYKASDLMQCNCIIWVEGPSDRIYLKHWMRAVDASLIEGLHYSIMFYGGRLLRHLTADDLEIEEFISLRRLNRYVCIIIDSDIKAPGRSINDTKKRIVEEVGQGGGVVWVTEGREIENYIDKTILLKSVQEQRPSAVKLTNHNRLGSALSFIYKNRRSSSEIDKIKLAHSVASREAVLNILDLETKVREVVNYVRDANDLPPFQDTGGQPELKGSDTPSQ